MRFLVLLCFIVIPLLSCSKSDDVSLQEQKGVNSQEGIQKQKAEQEQKTVPIRYKEGVHYSIIEGQPKPIALAKIEVMEFFWYGCPHCAVFDFILAPWVESLPSDVNFSHSPAMWQQADDAVKGAMWIHGEVYYTALALGVLDKVHPMFFQTMHKHKMRLVKHENIERLINELGLDGKTFVDTLNTPAIQEQVVAAIKRIKTYKITGTPELVVGGYYHVSTRIGVGQKEMLKVADFLVNKIRANEID